MSLRPEDFLAHTKHTLPLLLSKSEYEDEFEDD
jgi:hypothetical protein